MGYIDSRDVTRLASKMGEGTYGHYLSRMLDREVDQ
jgi:hypothetical protein